jgi:hypothetical protein
MRKDLNRECELFYKLAASKDKKKYADFLSWCYDAVKTYASFLPSKEIAEKIFTDINSYRKTYNYTPQTYLDKIEKIEAKLFLIQDMSAKLDMPVAKALELKGMKNVNPNIVDVLNANISTFKDTNLKSLDDFKKAYKHYYLLLPGADDPRLTVNLDEYLAKKDELGF